MDGIYLDNSSTTKPCEEAVKAINNCLENCWGNPSSLHEFGFEAELTVKDARQSIAKILGAKADEIYFNSCGTEGDNTAILGAANAMKKRGSKIVTTAVEHPAVLECMKKLESEGFNVVYIKPDTCGHISESAIYNAVDKSTVLVSIMTVNNEVGSVFPVQSVKRIIKEKNSPALFHTDAVQAFGKMPINVNRWGVDLLTLSGHKIHASKGIGALYINKNVHIKPLILGGGQEKGMRSGTESVPLIAGLGAAVNALPDLTAQLKKQKELWDYTKTALENTGLCVVNSPDDALPYVLNVSVTGYRSETLLHFLENSGIYVSSGSACSKGRGSYVLTEMGLPSDRVDSALRISFSRFNTFSDADKLAAALTLAAKKLRRADL